MFSNGRIDNLVYELRGLFRKCEKEIKQNDRNIDILFENGEKRETREEKQNEKIKALEDKIEILIKQNGIEI